MKLLITREIPSAGLNILKEHPEIKIDYKQGDPLTDKELKEAIKGADAIIPIIPDKISKEVLESAGPGLKLVAHYAVGYDNIDIESATKMGIYVSNTPGDLTESVAEFTLGLMFAISKSIVSSDKYTRLGNYKYWDPMIFLGPTLMGKTLGIVGFGRIGKYLATIAHNGLEMEILYSDPVQHMETEKEIGAKKVELEELLENSDFVSLNCPLTDETRYLIGHKELEKMKPTAYLINTARGPVVNEAALYTALKEKWIEGAALDVFENEPNLYDGLSELENVIVTPHIASATREARIQMAIMAANNVVDVLINNSPPRNLVNKDLAEKSTPSLV
jgi:glyoxylate reductase